MSIIIKQPVEVYNSLSIHTDVVSGVKNLIDITPLINQIKIRSFDLNSQTNTDLITISASNYRPSVQLVYKNDINILTESSIKLKNSGIYNTTNSIEPSGLTLTGQNCQAKYLNNKITLSNGTISTDGTLTSATQSTYVSPNCIKMQINNHNWTVRMTSDGTLNFTYNE